MRFTETPQQRHLECTGFITYPSYFYHLFTQLLLHHDSHTTNFISFSSPSTSSPFHHHQLHLLFLTTTAFIFRASPACQHPVLSNLPPANNAHQSSSFSVLHKLLPFHLSYLNYTSPPAPKSAHQASCHTASYAFALQDVALHLPFYSRQVPPNLQASWCLQ